MQLYLDYFLAILSHNSKTLYLVVNMEKYHRIWWYFVELLSGLEPPTSSLPRKKSTPPNGITLLCSTLKIPLYLVVFILLYHYS